MLCPMQKKENPSMKENLLAYKKGITNAQIAHLQFARANAQTENCKRAIFLPTHEKKRSIFTNLIKE
jgi:hypothetical protein